jgi:hypothetical protein
MATGTLTEWCVKLIAAGARQLDVDAATFMQIVADGHFLFELNPDGRSGVLFGVTIRIEP